MDLGDFKYVYDCEFLNILKSLKDKMQDKSFAEDVYRALCNVKWKKIGYVPKDECDITRDCTFACSWRYAGGVVAEIRDCGENYLDFYCSGGEGTVTPEIEQYFKEHGWEKWPWK